MATHRMWSEDSQLGKSARGEVMNRVSFPNVLAPLRLAEGTIEIVSPPYSWTGGQNASYLNVRHKTGKVKSRCAFVTFRTHIAPACMRIRFGDLRRQSTP